MLEAATAYTRMGWKVFPLHGIVNGKCTCGKICSSPGKHPHTKRGFKDASTDPQQIRQWWTRWPDANIGVATGSGLAVLDIDGEEGFAEFRAFVDRHGSVPETLTSQTGRGLHLVYATADGAPLVRSGARGHVHVRGEGGYIVAPPSLHHSGRHYRWIKRCPIAALPDTLRQWSQGYDIATKTVGGLGHDALGQLPSYLQQSQRDIGQKLEQSLSTIWSASEQARLTSALAKIPPVDYEVWVQVGMALQQLGWERSDGSDLGFIIWDEWSQLDQTKYNFAACEAKWRSFGRGRSGVTLGTVYHMAREAGWDAGVPPVRQSNGEKLNGTHALPSALTAQGAIFFPDLTEDKKPRSTCLNSEVAIRALQIECEKDQFHEKLFAGGYMIERWSGDLTDEVIQMIRKAIRAKFGFDPGEKNVRDACIQMCLENQFDPVLDYLDGLKWDGTPRLDRWMASYLGAANTELNRTIGRLVLIAAVRRQRRPGTKFDQIVVLESKEGFGKSTAIEILAGSDNFSDQTILNKQEREQQEAMTGIWLYEIADLTGMKKADIEHIKSFASRTVDRARPAYGRFREDRPRRTIFFATTNDDDYLKSQTGNRRFWPVSVGRIDLASLIRDRDQLWAEAVACEARGDTIALPERLWKTAGDEQERRLEADSWEDCVVNYLAIGGKTDVTTHDVLVDNQFIRMDPARIGRFEQMRAGNILRKLGFQRYKKWVGTHTQNRYRRD